MGESEALELVLSGFEGDQWLTSGFVAGWRAFLLVDSELDRKTNQTPALPSRESQRCHLHPQYHFQVRFRVRVVTMVVVGLIVVLPEVW